MDLRLGGLLSLVLLLLLPLQLDAADNDAGLSFMDWCKKYSEKWTQPNFNVTNWKPASLYKYSPFLAEHQHSEIIMPRNYRPRYHGARFMESMNYTDAVRAMLGDRFAIAQSFAFNITMRFGMGLDINHQPTSPAGSLAVNRTGYSWRLALKQFHALKLQVPHRNLTETEGLCYAAYILDTSFNNLNSSGVDYYLKYKGYNPPLVDVIWTSIYFLPDYFYGLHTLVFQPDAPLSVVQSTNARDYPARGIDLNFYNKVHYNKWSNTHPQMEISNPDVGEFISPGYVDGDEVEAMIIRDNRLSQPGWNQVVAVEHRGKPATTTVTDLYPAPHVVMALVKDSWQGHPVVLVVDGHRSDGDLAYCIDKDEDGYWVYCGREFHPYPISKIDGETKNYPTPTYPINTLEEVKVMGVLTRCDPAECGISELREELRRAGREVPWSAHAGFNQALASIRFLDDPSSTLYITRF